MDFQKYGAKLIYVFFYLIIKIDLFLYCCIIFLHSISSFLHARYLLVPYPYISISIYCRLKYMFPPFITYCYQLLILILLLPFLKATCHANSIAVIRQAKSSLYIPRNVFKIFLNTLANQTISL